MSEYYNLTIITFLNDVYFDVISYLFMAFTDLIGFVMWSGLTAALMIITGIVYKSYQRKNSKKKFIS